MSITTISNRQEHDAVVEEARAGKPTVIYVAASATPVCKDFTPKYENFAKGYGQVQFCQMELDRDTSPMIKFGPQNTPILIMMKGTWAHTLLGGDLKGLEENIRQNMDAVSN